VRELVQRLAEELVDGAPRRRWWRGDWLLALALALLVTLAAFGRPLAMSSTHTLGDWIGLGYHYPLLEYPGAPPGAPTVSPDPLRQFVPWALYAGEELRAGRAPLWNPHSGNGAPLLANFQSAVLSPFTFPYYVLPLKWALLAVVLLRTIAATVGALLFLRCLGRSRFAAALGATSYALAGFHLSYPLHPHTAVLALLPFALFGVECCVRGFDAHDGRTPWRALAGLALALGLMVLAGHPESLLFCVYLVALYAALRLALTARGARDASARQRVAKLALAVLAAGLVGAALGAVQLAPFFEYMVRSATVAAGGRADAPWIWDDALLQILPDARSLVVSARWGEERLLANAHESTAFYAGGSTLLLAIAVLFVRGRDAVAWFFLALTVGLVLYLAQAPFAASLLGPLFGRDYVLASRATPLWSMPVSALAAFTVDRLSADARTFGARRAWLVALFGAGVLAVCRWSYHGKLEALREANPQGFEALRLDSLLQLDALTSAVLLVLAAVLVLASHAPRLWRWCAIAVALGATAFQGVAGYARFVPNSPDRYAQPHAPGAAALAELTRGERAVLLSSRGLPANINLNYGVELATSYDALELREVDALRGQLFGYIGYGGLALRASRQALDLFGVRYIATPSAWLPLDTERAHRFAPDVHARWFLGPEMGLPRELRSIELGAQAPELREEFTCSREGFDGLVVHFLRAESASQRRVRLEVVEVESKALLGARELRLEELRDVGAGRLECILELPAQSASASRRYELRIAAAELAADERVRVLVERWAPRVGARARSAGVAEGERAPARERVVLDMSYGRGDFAVVGTAGPMTVHRYEAGRGNAWIVARAFAAADSERALERVLQRECDLRSEVVLEGGGHAAGAEPLEVQPDPRLLERTPHRLRFAAKCAQPAYLVLAQPHYPGWVARVNGVPTELLRANYAFCAVALPAGESEVEVVYEPVSFRIGVVVSLVALLLIASALWLGRATARRAA